MPNPMTVTKDVIAKSEREAIARAETETGGKTVYVEKIGEEKINATLQLWRVTLEVPGVERVHYSDDEESLATRRWRLRVEAEELVKEIREERAKNSLRTA